MVVPHNLASIAPHDLDEVFVADLSLRFEEHKNAGLVALVDNFSVVAFSQRVRPRKVRQQQRSIFGSAGGPF